MTDSTLLDPDDYHRWVRPAGSPCPGCACCAATLCATAAERGVMCHHIGESGPGVLDLTRCPCAELAAARRLLALVPAADPSHPDPAADPAAELPEADRYRDRNGYVLAAARHLARAGVSVGIAHDPAEPDWPVLTIELPGAGQVTWHLPDRADGYDLPPAGPWDGHDTAEKYRRLSAWLDGPRPWELTPGACTCPPPETGGVPGVNRGHLLGCPALAAPAAEAEATIYAGDGIYMGEDAYRERGEE